MSTISEKALDYADKIETIQSALRGNRGVDQTRIAEVGLNWVVTLLQKNHDYGSSAWKVPIVAPDCDVGTAIRVRMSDKIHRMEALIKLGCGGNEVAESFDDTVNDLGAYCLLFLARPETRQSDLEEPEDAGPGVVPPITVSSSNHRPRI